MDRELKIECIMAGIVKDTYIPYRKNQSLCCGINSGVRISHPDIGITIQIDIHKSQLKNYDLAALLFRLAVEEYVK